MSKQSALYSYVRSRQFEKSYSEDPNVGAWVITAMRVMRGLGSVDNSEWPFTTNWPPIEPPNLDVLAKKSRIFAYQRIRDTLECKLALANTEPVVAAFEITDQWFEASGGVIEMPSPSTPTPSGHSVVIIGYDDNTEQLLFQNSWGETWGDKGFGYIPYQYFERFLTEAWIMISSPDSKPALSKEQKSLRNWGVPSLLAGLLHGIEIYNDKSDDPIGWVLAICRDGYLDVEELFVMPNFRGMKYGSLLASSLLELAKEAQLPLRLWVPHSDTSQENLSKVTNILAKLNLRLLESPVRWASYMAIPK